MFLSWVIGRERANEVLSQNLRVEEEDINPFPDKISCAIIQPTVVQELALFETLFTADAWKGVLQLSNLVYQKR